MATIAVSALVSGLYKLSQVSDEVAKKAQELGAVFEDTESDIGNYKEQVEDLYKTINDSESSIEQVTEARKTLMSVQDALIEKFGDEKDTIDIITQAIDNQSTAWDKLTDSQWQVFKNEFNRSDFANNVDNFFGGYSDNIDRMLDEYENHSAVLDINSLAGHLPKEELHAFLKELSNEFGAELNVQESATADSYFATIKGNVDEVYEKILKIQSLSKKYKFDDKFSQELTDEFNRVSDVISDYGYTYDTYVLRERIFPNVDYKQIYNTINDAYSAYQDAFMSGDKQLSDKAVEHFATILSEASEKVTDKSVIEHFKNMYPTMQNLVEKWEFKANILPKFDTRALSGLNKNDILGMLKTDGLQYGEQTFESIINLAIKYGLITERNNENIQILLDMLEEWGILQAIIHEEEDGKASFADIFANDDIEKLSKSIDDIQNAYKTLDDAITEYNTSGSLSLDTLQSVVDLGDDWLDCLVDEEGTLKLDKEALQDLTKSRLEDMRVQALNNVIDNVGNIQGEIDAKKYLESTNYELANSYQELAKANLEATLLSLKDKLTPDQYADVEQKALADIEKINKLFDKVTVDDLSMRGGSADDKSVFSDLLEKEATLLEKQLEASVITFKEYSDKRKALIEEFYKAGKISAEEYYSALEKMHDYDLSVYDKVIGAVTKKIDDQIEALEKEKETIEENHQTKIDAIQEEIDALTKANDAKQAQIELEKAQYEAEQARRNRVQKVYNGQEVIYQADMEKVRDTQEAVEDKEFDMHISKLEDQIESLEEEMDKATKVIDDQIEKLEEYKDEWNSVADAYSDAQDELLAKQILGQDLEKMILDTRMAELTIFKDNYIAAQQAMATAAWQSANEQVKAAQEAAKGAGGNGNGKSGNVDGGQKTAATVKDTNVPKTGGSTSSSIVRPKKNKQHSMVALYHDGLDKGYVGDSVSDDKRLQLLQTAASGQLRPDEVPAILKKKELVFTEEQQKNILSALLSPADYGNKIISSIGKSKLNAQSSHAQSVSFTVGDIYLEKVNDVDKLSQAIINQFPNKALQALYKTK